jgi:hypothetical protein
MEKKWTDGLPYERSRRLKHLAEMEKMENKEFSKDTENSAYNSALNHDENTWDILNQSLSGTGFKVSNKREELDSKISDRHLIQQTGFNPFFNESNYVNDISVRDQFLKPVNTTSERTKNES